MAMLRPTSEMKDSGIEWYGACPVSWSKVPLYSALTEINQKNDPIVTTNILSLTNTEGVIPYSERGNQGNKSKENYEEYKVVYPNTIVANSMNILIGSVGLSAYEGCVSPVYYVYEAKPQYDIRYLNYLFSMEAFQKRLRQFANGIMEIRLRVSSHDILHQNVMMPSFEEQNTIANYLDGWCSKIDEIIAEATASIEEYKELKQAVIFEAVTKGLEKNVPMKDSGVKWIGAVPEEWIVIKTKYTTRISRGLFNHRPRNAPFLYDGPYPFIQTGDVARANHYITEYNQTLSEQGRGVSKFFPAGTLTMTIAANVGDVSILTFGAYFPDSVLGFVPYPQYSSEYLYYIFSAMKNEFVRIAISNTQMNLNIERVKETFIPVVDDKHKQQAIVDYLDERTSQIDALISEKQALIDDLQAYKKSLIYEVVTGKRRVV